MIAERLSLLVVLLTTMFTSLLATALANFITQPRRPHNLERLTSEFLARHQLGYISFYFSVLLVFRPSAEYEWLQRLVFLLIVASLFAFSVGLRQTTRHERLIRQVHQCPGEGCDVELPAATKWRILRLNLALGLFSFALAVLVALHPAVTTPPR